MKRILLLLCLLFPSPALAAIGVGTAVRQTTVAGDPASSFSGTCSANADRMILFFSYTQTTTISSGPTYNGVALTPIGSAYEFHTGHHLMAWRLVNPATGSNTLAVTFSGASATFWNVAVCLDGVDGTTPVGALGTATNSDTTITQNVSSESGDMVFDFVTVAHSGGGGSVAVGAGQTSVIEDDSWNSGFFSSGLSREDGGATITMSWTTASVTKWGSVAVNVNAVGAGPPAVVPRVINY